MNCTVDVGTVDVGIVDAKDALCFVYIGFKHVQCRLTA